MGLAGSGASPWAVWWSEAAAPIKFAESICGTQTWICFMIFMTAVFHYKELRRLDCCLQSDSLRLIGSGKAIVFFRSDTCSACGGMCRFIPVFCRANTIKLSQGPEGYHSTYICYDANSFYAVRVSFLFRLFST